METKKSVPAAHGRDFVGYAHAPSAARWPGDKRLAVSFVANLEEGAELSLGMGDETNEHVYEAIERVEGVRDLCMESQFEYGTRVGWGRIRAALKAYGVRATLNACGRAIALSPWIAREAVADGHDVSPLAQRVWRAEARPSETAEGSGS